MSKDDDTRKGYSPKKWGPHLWDSLHYITLGYPKKNAPLEVRKAARELMESLPHLLPCRKCRDHLFDIYRKQGGLRDSIFENRETFGRYVVELRDYVKLNHVYTNEWQRSFHRAHSFDALEERLECGTSPLEGIRALGAVFVGFSCFFLLLRR